MKRIESLSFEGERPLFQCVDSELDHLTFLEGESALKEGKNLLLTSCEFTWKYPLWYGKNLTVNDCTFGENARAAFWYDENVQVERLVSYGPKGFRKMNHVVVKDSYFHDGGETFWQVENFVLENVTSRNGQYFMMQSKNGKITHLDVESDYLFDGVENLVIEDSLIKGKDAFWNSKNITLKNCTLRGQYLAWNAKNLTLIHCDISSLQGLCYIDGLKMIDCTLNDTDLCFEYCSNIDAEITGNIVSVKNPLSGKIVADSFLEIIYDDPKVDPSKTKLVARK